MALSRKAKERLQNVLAGDVKYDGVVREILAAIDAGANPQGAAVADIGDTSTATTEEVGDKLNELLGSLRAASIIAS